MHVYVPHALILPRRGCQISGTGDTEKNLPCGFWGLNSGLRLVQQAPDPLTISPAPEYALLRYILMGFMNFIDVFCTFGSLISVFW